MTRTTLIMTTSAFMLGLSACTAMTPAPDTSLPPAADSCQASAGQSYLGQTASAAVGAKLLAATGAREIRWAPPHMMLTMDYKYGRLTVSYDDDYRITRIACG